MYLASAGVSDLHGKLEDDGTILRARDMKVEVVSSPHDRVRERLRKHNSTFSWPAAAVFPRISRPENGYCIKVPAPIQCE